MAAGVDGPWRILLVDDSRDDAELTEIALRDAGLAFHCRRADTADAVRAALAEFDPHLVISDLNLPGFSGGEALELVRAHDPALRSCSSPARCSSSTSHRPTSMACC